MDTLLDGAATLDEAWEAIQAGLARDQTMVSLLHLAGVAPCEEPLELEHGFRLVTSSGEEWLEFQPRCSAEQLEPATVVRQTFLQNRKLRLLAQPRLFSTRQRGPRRDPLWEGWWVPLLGLALYRPEQFSDGVRVEVEPRWRRRQHGDFGDYGDELPWGGEDDAPNVWQPYRSCDYDVREGEERERLRAFVRRVMRTARRAHAQVGDPMAIAAKRFLSASFHLAPNGDWRNGAHDVNEQVLLDLVRSADGLFLVAERYEKTRKFKERVALASGLGDDELESFLDEAYDARSRIAHGDAEPPPVDLSRLHEVVRFAFIGRLGLFEAGLVPAQMRAGALPPQVGELHRMAVAGSRDPSRRGRRCR